MPDELQEGVSTEEPQVTPAGEAQPDAPKMVPVEDLRSLQATKDREVSAAKREAATAQQRLAALEASMETLAHRTMEPQDAQAFIQDQRGQRQQASLQQQAAMATKYEDIFKMSRQNEVPISEFEGVLADSNATPADAQAVVTNFWRSKVEAAEKAVQKQEQEAAVATAQVQRQTRNQDGSDKIGTPAEPATGSPDLEAQYQEEKNTLIAASQRNPRGKDWLRALIDLKAKYREQGLTI